MKKPSAAAIRAALPLSKLPTRGADPVLVCTVCGAAVDPSDLPSTVWREHDERDLPIAGNGALVFLGPGKAHARCRKALDDHPRLYAEETGQPGAFPALCGGCAHRSGDACRHPDAKANGGPGLVVRLGTPFAGLIICSRGGGCHAPVANAVQCDGRAESLDARDNE